MTNALMLTGWEAHDVEHTVTDGRAPHVPDNSGN